MFNILHGRILQDRPGGEKCKINKITVLGGVQGSGFFLFFPDVIS
jgi:hypothetical protein